MNIKKLKRSIEEMPRPAYIFLRWLLILCCGMLALSLALFILRAGFFPRSRQIYHLAVLLLENPAGVLLMGAMGLAFILDRS